MIKFSVKIKSIQRIPELQLKPYQTNIVRKNLVKYIIDRVQLRHTDVYDAMMPEYADRPIYVRVGARGMILGQNRIPITSVNALRKSGVNIINLKGDKSRVALTGKYKNSVVRTGNSIRFPNRAAYKRFLGRSGLRDFTETGAMLASLGVVSQSGIYSKVIVLGFRNAFQEIKAKGQIYPGGTPANWVGISPIDQIKLVRLLNGMFADNLGISQSFVTTKGYSTVTAQ